MAPAPTALHDFFESLGADFHSLHGSIVPLRVSGVATEYQACQEGFAIFDGGDRAWLEVSGSDAESFLQRLLTSNIAAAKMNQSQWSALLDGKGYWLVELLVFRVKNADGIEVIGLDMPLFQRDLLLKLLEKFHFGEDVVWKRRDFARLLMVGPGAQQAMQNFETPLLLQRPDRGACCLEVLTSAADAETMAKSLLEDGAVAGGLVALDILRVEAGIPRFGTDFDETGILPESEEWQRASLSKGCYAGQEVIAKVNTYGEAPRRLCRLQFGSGTTPLSGLKIETAEGKEVGKVTSWVWSPQTDAPVGLGTLKRKALREDAGNLFVAQEDIRILLKAEVREKAFG